MLNPFKIDYAELLFSSDIYIASIIVAIILLFNFENTKDETVGQFLVDSQASNWKEIKTENNTQDSKKKKKGSHMKIYLGLIPYILMAIHGVYDAINGFTFFFSTSYGVEAFLAAILFDFIIFLPVNIIVLALLISYSIDIRKQKNLIIINSFMEVIYVSRIFKIRKRNCSLCWRRNYVLL